MKYWSFSIIPSPSGSKNKAAKMSLPKAVFLESNAPIRPPGMVNAGADKSRDWPSVSKN